MNAHQPYRYTFYEPYPGYLKEAFQAADERLISKVTDERIGDQWQRYLRERNIEIKTRISSLSSATYGCTTGAILGWALSNSCVGACFFCYLGGETGIWARDMIAEADPTALTHKEMNQIIAATVASFMAPHFHDRLEELGHAILRFRQAIQLQNITNNSLQAQQIDLLQRVDNLRATGLLQDEVDQRLEEFQLVLLNPQYFSV